MGGKGQEKGKSPAQDGKSLAAASAGGAAEMAASDGAGPSGSWRDREPPPPFDGRDPSRSFPRWLKELKLWEFETEIPKNKRGVKVLRQLSGAARSTADNLSFEEIACEKGLDNLLAALEEHFKPHLETSLPKAFEEAIYGDIRGSKETFGEFVIRMEYAFKELERQGVKLHDMVIGYVMFRHANLNDVQESQMLTWGEGKFDRAVVVRNLRRLDKGVHDSKKKGSHYLLDTEVDSEYDEGVPETYVEGPSFEDDESDFDEDYVYIGEGEMQDTFEESDIQEALATYQDVRRSLREQKNSRGYYPAGRNPSSGKGSGGFKGKGKGKGKGRVTLGFKNRDYVKFSRDGSTKVHVDMLKLRTRCARCGALGHWAKECRNPPDERGRIAAAQRASAASSSSTSTRSGFFVQAESPNGVGSAQGYFVQNSKENSTSSVLMSFVPTFGSVLRAVMRDKPEQTEHQLEYEPAPVFVGVVTGAHEGVVDTAAQDGLIGKAALLRLAESLRKHGLQFKWNTEKKAQACGVGGKATVLGIAEVPIGIAGVNGLIELTVVTDNVPLLLPIKLLKQLRAVIDLDRDILDIREYGVEAPMHALPSGHMSVDVTAFSPDGWKLPDGARGKAQHEQFVFATHSMISLKQTVTGNSKPAENHGIVDAAAHARAERARWSSPWKTSGSDEEPKSCKTLASGGREGVRPDDPGRPSRKGAGLAAKFLFAALGAGGSFTGPMSFYPSEFNCSSCKGQTAGVWRGDPLCQLPWNTSDEGQTANCHRSLQTPGAGVEGRGEPAPEGDLLQQVQGPLGVPQSDTTGPEEGREGSRMCRIEQRADEDHHVSVWQAGSKLAGKERGSNEGPTLLSMREESVRVLPLGHQGADGNKGPAGNGVGRLGGVQRGDCKDPKSSGEACGSEPRTDEGAHAADGEQVPGSDGSSGSAAPDRDTNAARAGRLVSELHESASSESDGGLPDGRPLKLEDWLPVGIGPQQACLIQTAAQLKTARSLQMRAFGSQHSYAPWSMPISKSYYVWDDDGAKWDERNGWLPRSLQEDEKVLAVFEDEAALVAWSEEFGKTKALTAGERKRMQNAIGKFVQVSESTETKDWRSVEWLGVKELASASFWSRMAVRQPEYMVIEAECASGEDLEAALDLAAWQDATGKAFLMLHSECDADYVEAGTSCDGMTGRRVQQVLDCKRMLTGNHPGLMCAVSNEMGSDADHEAKLAHVSENLVAYQKAHHHDDDSISQNQEAHHHDDNSISQNQEAHHHDDDSISQNQEAHHCDDNSISQNQEAHHCDDSSISQNQEASHSYLSEADVGYLEGMARRLIRERDYSLVSFEKFVERMPSTRAGARSTTIAGSYLVFGMYSHGNRHGVTNRTKSLPNCAMYLNNMMKFQCKIQGIPKPTWTTISLGLNAGSSLHRDLHNKRESQNYVIGAGSYRRGEIWIQDDEVPESRAVFRNLPNGKRQAGKLHNIKHRVLSFDPKRWHESRSWSGSRYVATAFTARGVDAMEGDVAQQLHETGFPVPRCSEKCGKVYVQEEDELDERQQPVDDALEPTAEEKRLIKKLHENMGHPAGKEMARSLRLANAKPHVVRYVATKFECDVCKARPKPKPARPAVLPKSYEPGKVVGVDVVFLSALDKRETFPALNMVDWGTGYQMVERLKNTESDHAWRTFLRVWGRVFGVPEIIIADLGTEFRGQFAEMAAQAGALIRHTAARSPWQAGKTERAGAHYKHVYEKARETTQISTWEELKTLLYEVENAKNRYGNRSGFSPTQRQIGHNLRLPGSLLSDDPTDPRLVVQSAGDEMRRVLELRQAAQEAYIKSQTQLALTRARNARSRIPPTFVVGETVYVYRQPKERKRRHMMTEESHEGRKPSWVGPGVVLAIEQPSLWVSMKGELWKVSCEHCRHATSEEQLTKELLAGELEVLREELGRSSQKRTYKDMTEEPGPPDEEEEAVELRGGMDWHPEERAHQRPRLLPEDVPVPEGPYDEEELAQYEPSIDESVQEQIPVPQAGHSPTSTNVRQQSSEEEPEPAPSRQMSSGAQELSPETVQTVLRNQQMDGHPPGSAPYEATRRLMSKRPPSSPYYAKQESSSSSQAWFYAEDGRWKVDLDCWEDVSRNVVVRRHYEPRRRLCNPTKIRGALMPRRLKHRQTYMVMEDGTVDTYNDNWFKQRKKVNDMKKSWVGFTVFSSTEVNIHDYMATKTRGQGEVFEHEIKPHEWPAWRESDLQEWCKVASTDAIKVLSLEESRAVRADLRARGQQNGSTVEASRATRRASSDEIEMVHSWRPRSRSYGAGSLRTNAQ